jgi:PAS domain S-box-containing protein
VNEATTQITGYSREELVGQSSRLVYATDADFAAVGRLYPDFAGQSMVTTETHWRRKDGTLIYIMLNIALIDPQDPAQGVTFVALDITERKRAETALQESEQKFRTLFEHMSEGVALHEVVFNGEGTAVDYRILDANPAYGRHTGATVDKVRGRLVGELCGTGSPPYLPEFAEVARTGKPHEFEADFAPMRKHFHVSVVSPKPGFFATVFEDITDRIQREEELRRKNEELQRFTYTVSHDLKSPLITIKGFAGALMQDAAAGRFDRLQEDLKRITSATDKMAALLNDLLELSRIGRMMNPPTEVKVDRLVQEVLELLAGPIGQRSVRLIVQPDLPTVQGDRRRLSEVFQNLIENAIRFLGDQPEPRIEIGVRDQGHDRVFFVRDNGMGIEPCYHETVFGLFNKLDAKTPGTGIGLALVRRIIEVHGGKVWVESTGTGHGATFCFTLPPNLAIRKDSQP